MRMSEVNLVAARIGPPVVIAFGEPIAAMVTVTRFINGNEVAVRYPVTLNDVLSSGGSMRELVASAAQHANECLDTAAIAVNSKRAESFSD